MSDLRERMHDGHTLRPDGPGTSEALSEEDLVICIKGPGFFPERPTALERFERRVEEIARAAEAGKRPFVKDLADLCPSFGKQRLPEVGDERGFPGANAGEDPRRHRAHARVERWPRILSPEARDCLPFGLKRRVAVGFPPPDAEDRPGSAALPGSGRKPIEADSDQGIRVPIERGLAGEPDDPVSADPRVVRKQRNREEAQIRKIRRAVARVALYLVADVMAIEDALEVLGADIGGDRDYDLPNTMSSGSDGSSCRFRA